jgi:protein-S-isoprenylcysteine O-methyltransferase Ste14
VNSESKPEVANLGWVRPPLVYLGSIVAGLVLNLIWPLAFAVPAARPIGGTMVLTSVLLFLFSIRELRAARTPVRGNQPTTTIVRRGPYRFSRNPVYLSFFLLQLGIAVWIGSVWMLATLVLAAGLISCAVIPKEEQYLERKFGSHYLSYRTSVRRWL